MFGDFYLYVTFLPLEFGQNRLRVVPVPVPENDDGSVWWSYSGEGINASTRAAAHKHTRTLIGINSNSTEIARPP